MNGWLGMKQGQVGNEITPWVGKKWERNDNEINGQVERKNLGKK